MQAERYLCYKNMNSGFFNRLPKTFEFSHRAYREFQQREAIQDELRMLWRAVNVAGKTIMSDDDYYPDFCLRVVSILPDCRHTYLNLAQSKQALRHCMMRLHEINTTGTEQARRSLTAIFTCAKPKSFDSLDRYVQCSAQEAGIFILFNQTREENDAFFYLFLDKRGFLMLLVSSNKKAVDYIGLQIKMCPIGISCSGCGIPTNKHKCSRCMSVYYCSTDCQRAHFPEHNVGCKQVAEESKRVKRHTNAADLANELRLQLQVQSEEDERIAKQIQDISAQVVPFYDLYLAVKANTANVSQMREVLYKILENKVPTKIPILRAYFTKVSTETNPAKLAIMLECCNAFAATNARDDNVQKAEELLHIIEGTPPHLLTELEHTIRRALAEFAQP